MRYANAMMLTAFFKQRDCVGLQRPIIDEAELGKLAFERLGKI